MKADIYTNINGVENHFTKEINDSLDETLSFMDAMHDAFFGNGSLLDSALELCPRSSNKEITKANFPKSTVYLDTKDKTYNILIDAVGVKENEYMVEVDGDKIVVTFDHKLTDKEKSVKLYSHKYRTITNETATFEFDPKTHNIDTADVKLENGCLSITIQPREELKPVRKVLGGGLKKEEEEYKADTDDKVD